MKAPTFMTSNGQVLDFSVLDDRLFMIHGEFISAQWPLDKVGIRVEKQPTNIKLSILSMVNQSYQAFYFERIEYQKLFDYFHLLGFCRNHILCQTDITDSSKNENTL